MVLVLMLVTVYSVQYCAVEENDNKDGKWYNNNMFCNDLKLVLYCTVMMLLFDSKLKRY